MNIRNEYHVNLFEAALMRFRRSLHGSNFKGSWRLRQLLEKKCLVPSRLVEAKTLYGFKIVVNPQADPYQRMIFESGTYEPGTLAFMQKTLRPGDTFIDVGANIGLMTLLASQCVGPSGAVYAFEPEPENYRRLLENIALNDANNVTAVQSAVGEIDEVRPIFSFASVNVGRASLINSNGANKTGETKVISLSSFINKKSINNVKMIKIDVEGFEHEVLAGARSILASEQAPILCVECDDDMPRESDNGGMAAIHKLINGFNHYDAYKLVETKFSANPKIEIIKNIDQIIKHDNIIYVPNNLLRYTNIN